MKTAYKKHLIGLKDIAKEAGVAVPTVSLILNGRTNTFISQATRDRVKEIAARLRYRPKFSHKLLHGRETGTVAILITEAAHRADEHIKSLVLLLIEKLEHAAYSSYITTLAGNAEERVSDLIDRGCRGFIVIGMIGDAKALEALFRENGMHYIGFNSTLDRNIISDTPAAAEKIVRRFIAQGRDFRLLMNEERESYAPNSRFLGLMRTYPDLSRDALRQRFVVPLERVERDGIIDAYQSGYETTRALFDRCPEVNALFYFTDLYALGGAKWLIENGISVGSDVLVAGFNNTDAVKYHPFPISSGDQNIDAVSGAIVENLFADGPCAVGIEPSVILR